MICQITIERSILGPHPSDVGRAGITRARRRGHLAKLEAAAVCGGVRERNLDSRVARAVGGVWAGGPAWSRRLTQKNLKVVTQSGRRLYTYARVYVVPRHRHAARLGAHQ